MYTYQEFAVYGALFASVTPGPFDSILFEVQSERGRGLNPGGGRHLGSELRSFKLDHLFDWSNLN